MSEASLPGADQETEMYGYLVELKGARAVKSGTKASFDLRVAGQQSVGAFKNILDTEEGIPAGWQSLLMSGKVLDDGQTLPGDRDGRVQLQLKLAPTPVKDRDLLKLKVKSVSGKTYSLDFSLEDTVALAKSRIYKHTGIPPHQQQLSHRDVLLENHAPLQLYGLRRNATLELRLRFRLLAEFSPERRLEVAGDEMNTIANIKAKIFELTELPLDNLKVSYKGKLLDDHRTLAHYSIGEGAVLSVTCPVAVKVEEAGLEVPLDLEPGATTAGHLRGLLEARHGLTGGALAAGDGDALDEDQDVLETLRSGKGLVLRAGSGDGDGDGGDAEEAAAPAEQAADGGTPAAAKAAGRGLGGAGRGAGKKGRGPNLSVVGSQKKDGRR